MTSKTVTVIAALFVTAAALSSCGNTIRGVGADAANTVDATQSAGRNVDRAEPGAAAASASGDQAAEPYLEAPADTR